MLIDTHCHLNFDRYDEDRDDLLTRAANAGVTQVVNPGIDLDSSRAGIALSQQYDGVYAAVGVHPNSTANWSDDWLAIFEQMATENTKVVAIGEIGLDYYWDKSPKDVQAKAFRAQLGLAAHLELPVIIHNRDAGSDVMDILEAWVKILPPSLKERPGVLHSFLDTLPTAQRALDAGFYIGFTGPVTFKNGENVRHIAAQVPLNRILVETDGPFLTPHPYRGKRNEPAYIPHIVERLAAIHGLSSEEMGRHTTENANRLFNL
jgi:TatD DNase family protein